MDEALSRIRELAAAGDAEALAELAEEYYARWQGAGEAAAACREQLPAILGATRMGTQLRRGVSITEAVVECVRELVTRDGQRN